VAEKIVRGELLAGVTDSDDFLSLTHDLSESAKSAFSANSFYDNDFPNDNEPLPNQPRISGVFIPGSVAVLKNAPHRSDAQKLVNALLSPDAENSLVRQMPGVVATRQFRAGRDWRDYQTQLFPHSAQVPNDTDKWAESWDEIREPLAQILLSD
jgi:ABC-type Fe3+ transport system substrate-binding protein